MFPTAAAHLPLEYFVLAPLVIAAAWIDWKSHRIPNWLVGAGIVAGVACNAMTGGVPGALAAALGMAVGGTLLLPLYAAGGLGAGDVKLMAMVGAFLGGWGVVSATVLTFLAGGAVAVVTALRSGSLARVARNAGAIVAGGVAHATGWRKAAVETAPKSAGRMPYGMAVAAGTALHIALTEMGVRVI